MQSNLYISFEDEKEYLLGEIDKAKKIVKINKLLNDHNYAFIHPYLFVYQINYLESLNENNTLDKEAIFDIFASLFFDLRLTANFIDGYFKERPNLNPFLLLIDQSVIMCLQKDYAGAINTLLPVIEGSIRHYFVNNKGKQNEEIIKSGGLLKVFGHLKCDYLELRKAYYKRCQDINLLDANQTKQLMKYQRSYVDEWFSILEDYFSKSLYLDTRSGNVSDPLNRHAIFHGFTSDIYYSLENYLKIFNSIIFLSWAFGLGDPNSKQLSTKSEEDILYKWLAFEKIRTISRLTIKIKSSIYSSYSEFDVTEFENDYDKDKIDRILIEAPAKNLEHRLEMIDALLIRKETPISMQHFQKIMKELKGNSSDT